MEKPEEGRQVYDKSRGVCLKLPGIRILLTGPWSIVALVILLALIVGVLYLVIAKSGPGLWLSGGLWLLFIVYWSTVAKNTAPTSSSESTASRQLHQPCSLSSKFCARRCCLALGGRERSLLRRMPMDIALSWNRAGEEILYNGVAGRAAQVNMIDRVTESSFDW